MADLRDGIALPVRRFRCIYCGTKCGARVCRAHDDLPILDPLDRVYVYEEDWLLWPDTSSPN